MPQTTASGFRGFQKPLLSFLKELTKHNDREWFQANKERYIDQVREPARAFIRSFAAELGKTSLHFVASDELVRGSLMRIYRDTRFAKDKTPYKTNVGIHFRHELCGDVHAPGFYVHIEPRQCFLGAGIWHPDAKSLAKIRRAIDQRPEAWLAARDDKRFRKSFELAGDSLKTAPRDYAKDHPLIEDLRRKDFIAVKNLTETDVLKPGFLKSASTAFQSSRPLMRFLCEAVGVPF